MGWEAILDRWGVTIVVVPADDEAYIERLRAAGWHEAYADGDAARLHGRCAMTGRLAAAERAMAARRAAAILSS